MSSPDSEVLCALYKQMLILRRFEENVARYYREGHIPGFVHLYIGEEAVATGVCAHLEQDDYITSTHRGHAHALAKGVPPRQVMAELYGRSTGCSGGRGGSMHLFSPEVGLLGTNGIVGPSILHGAGAAFSARYRGSSQIAVAFFGDGAGNTGSFHEGLNLASIWKLPIVFVCENNLYATETPFEKSTAADSVASRAAAYRMPGIQVDGQDVGGVYEAAGKAIARVREGEGPVLLECYTYRYVGHHEGDPGTEYRTREEVDEWRLRDPIQALEKRILDDDLVSKGDLDRIGKEVDGVIEDAIGFASESPWPSADGVEGSVYATRF